MNKPIMGLNDIVDCLHEKTGFYKMHIETLLKAIEECIFDNMALATPEQPTDMKLFTGMHLGAKITKAYMGENPKTKEKVWVESKRRPFVHMSRRYCEKVNALEQLEYVPTDTEWEAYDKHHDAIEKFS